MSVDDSVVSRVREKVNLPAGAGGPSDQNIRDGIDGFAREFNYWYIRVLKKALPKFKQLIVDRINPIVRGMELEGLSAQAASERLVHDYAQRNFVTAGGWALEQLAIAGSPRLHKSSASGIDAEWHETGAVPVSHLYVIKSGTVTRNSDILAALKTNGKDAHKRLIQSNKKAVVRVYYAITSGAKTSTYHDGVYRPSSAEFWAQIFDLENDPTLAVDLALAMAQEAAQVVRSELGEREALEALQYAVCSYIAMREDPDLVDWEFLAQTNMRGDVNLKEEGKMRLARARSATQEAGYNWKPVIDGPLPE